MVFSNNMEYDGESIVPIQGAFYASVSRTEAAFNCFREEDTAIFGRLSKLDEATENFVLKDNNLAAIKDSAEYVTNKSADKPTNRILSSLLSKDRLALLLRYGLAYVDDVSGISKHILRYPQLFATLAIERAVENGTKKGIIWHTQGSGKTALAYFNVRHLTDYFQRLETIPRFYFIVDRLDLLTQAQTEFESRNLRVKIVNSRDDFVKNIKSQGAIQNAGGENEITVVNIQKFSEDSRATKQGDYDLNVQRVYFLDEVHRSYNPRGSFLANLMTSDPNAIFIGLTGTPLIRQKLKAEDGQKAVTFNSRDVFGGYIHKYYYNLSIEDGYTVRLIREGIETQYQAQLKEILDQIELLKGSAKKSEVFAHTRYVTELANYIVGDFEKSRVRLNDATIGGMVVCDTSMQARELFRVIGERHPQIKASLILHDVDDKETRRNNRDDFKRGNIDLLIVFNMLLTGFDAHRLKKLYLNRVIKDHSLLQTLTRVNRPYRDFHYGIVDDFKNQIRKTRDAMQNNFDHDDPVYVSLAEELERIFRKKKVTEMSTDDIQENIVMLRGIYERITEQNRRDALLKAKYEHDEKFTRIHKRIVEKKPDWKMISINLALLGIKYRIDDRILHQKAVLHNEPYFTQSVQPLVINSFAGNALKLDSATARQINDLITGEYMREYRGVAAV